MLHNDITVNDMISAVPILRLDFIYDYKRDKFTLLSNQSKKEVYKNIK